MDEVLQQLNTNKARFHISLDRRTPRTLKYLNTLLSYIAGPAITLPTRVTNHSSTIIDHIITNNTLNKTTLGILRNDSISDHFSVFCNINECVSFSSSYIFIREKSKFDIGAFKVDMLITLNDLVNKLPSLNVVNFKTNLDNFVHSVKSVIDRHVQSKSYPVENGHVKTNLG